MAFIISCPLCQVNEDIRAYKEWAFGHSIAPFSMQPLSKLFNDLAIIACVKKHGRLRKLQNGDLTIENRFTCSVRRWLTGDSRTDILDELHCIVDLANDYLALYSFSNPSMVTRIVVHLENAQTGLSALQSTYESDILTKVRFDQLIVRFQTLIAQYKTENIELKRPIYTNDHEISLSELD